MNGTGQDYTDRAYLRIHYGEHIDFINVLPFHFVWKRKDVSPWLLL